LLYKYGRSGGRDPSLDHLVTFVSRDSKQIERHFVLLKELVYVCIITVTGSLPSYAGFNPIGRIIKMFEFGVEILIYLCRITPEILMDDHGRTFSRGADR
jgi:hypothetical protein